MESLFGGEITEMTELTGLEATQYGPDMSDAEVAAACAVTEDTSRLYRSYWIGGMWVETARLRAQLGQSGMMLLELFPEGV